MALWSEGWISVTVKLAFMAGSSKQGKAFRASAACICVVATTFLQANLVSARGPLQGLAPPQVPPLSLRPARSRPIPAGVACGCRGPQRLPHTHPTIPAGEEP